MTQRPGHRGFRTFLVIWSGQLVSLTGSGLTGFALGVWVYQRTGSVTQFALISLFTALPGIVFSPLAGALVDRWDRRWAMILSDAGAGLCTLIVALLLAANRLEVWQIYILMALSSTFSAFQWPAYSASITQLVPKEHFGRASGMVQLGEAFAQIASPTLAGVLIGVIRVEGIILIDFLTFIFAVVTLSLVHVPKPKATEEGKAGQGSLLREAAYGWKYIRARPGLLGLLLLFAATNFTSGIVQVLFTPLVLSFTTAAVLGTILSIGGLGFLGGSLTMSAWGGPKVRVYGIYVSLLLQGVVLFAAGFPPQVTVLAAAAFLYFFNHPIVNGCSQAIWQSKTAPDVQGRVFAVRRMIAWSSLPLAYLAAGPLADQVFEPLLAEGGALASSVGQIIGTGEGRGIGLLFIILGIVSLLATAVGILYPRLRQVETELPDITIDGDDRASEVGTSLEPSEAPPAGLEL
ncbi:MAG: MFS transporter [Anaerolineae bacterium]|nr:MFS transporter [Anaerolineae bacterium]